MTANLFRGENLRHPAVGVGLCGRGASSSLLDDNQRRFAASTNAFLLGLLPVGMKYPL